jgi:hypothetical protein
VTQIFCDESGGADQKHFLVTAIRMNGEAATRMVKTIRKALRINGELKGNHLTIDQIQKVFSILESYSSVLAVSVICAREDALGGWAFGEHKEHIIWGELIVESCVPLHQTGVRGVVPDGGRYKRTVIRSVEADVTQVLADRTGLPLIPVQCAESAGTPGIQLADIIGNTVYRSLGTFTDATECRKLLASARDAGRLQIRMLEMKERRPSWMIEAVETPCS